MNIRTAERRDLSAMLDIYNYEVKNGTATFDVEPRAGAVGEAWFAAHNTGNHPLLVAEEVCAAGSVGEALAAALAKNGVAAKLRLLSLGSGIVPQGSVTELRTRCGIDSVSIARAARELLGETVCQK